MMLLTSSLIDIVYVNVSCINNIINLVCFISLIIGYFIEGLCDEGKEKILELLLIAILVSFVSGVEFFLENDELATMLGLLLMITGYFVEVIEGRRCKKITKTITLVVYSLSVPIIIILLSFFYEDIKALIKGLVMFIATLICCLVEIFWHGDGKYYKRFGLHLLFNVFSKNLLLRNEII